MSKTVREREQRRREGRKAIKELRKWEERLSEKMYNRLMLGRLVDAKTYADVNRIVCILEKRLHECMTRKLMQNL